MKSRAVKDPQSLLGCSHTCPAGFSLLELMIASLLALLVVGGILLMLQSLQDVHRNSQELIEAQQTARICLEQMQRDLQLAGVGLAGLLSPLPPLLPRVDGGVDIRYNPQGVTASLTADMGGATGDLEVDDASDFAAGMVVAVYDSTGSLDIVTVTSVDENSLNHDGASKAYTVADGTAVSQVQTVTYELQLVAGVQTLMRSEDGGAAQPIANNLVALNLVYYNDANPPQPFTPITVADQLRIRAVEVTVEIETENVKLNTTERPSVTLTARVIPRAVVLTL